MSNWTCGFCQRDQAITSERADFWGAKFDFKESKFERPGIFWQAFVCSNNLCREITLSLQFGECATRINTPRGPFINITEEARHWQLLPASRARPMPDYIKPHIVEDYAEACAILSLSPKGSATLARRCLQGMIRDFCGISKKRLIDEIGELRRRVEAGQAPAGVQADTIDAIDAVRKLGNIGAHMERDVDLIVEVDPGEAEAMIHLLEMLFEDWYVQRNKRAERLRNVTGAAGAKEAAKQPKN